MTKAFKNPYATLNVKKTASEKEIRTAAKVHAKKNHPDAGGDRDEFENGRRALAILLDPKARERFDRTGETEPNSVDNTLSSAMQIIEAEFDKLIDRYLNSGFNPQIDPCRMKVVTIIENEIKKVIAANKKARNAGDRFLKFLKKFARQFSKKSSDVINFDFVQRRFDDQMRRVEAQFAEIDKAVAAHELALKIIQSYDFKVDEKFVTTGSSSVMMPGGFVIRVG